MSVKKEFATMHLRRLLVVLLGNYPEFFFNSLKYSLATTYGQDRLNESEIARREKAGKIKAGQSADFRLPGPFSFVTYWKHILQNKSWGDAHILTLISMMWQVTITSLNADTLGEIHIRHDRPIDKADIVVIHAGGDHYMGCGKLRRFNYILRRFNIMSCRVNTAGYAGTLSICIFSAVLMHSPTGLIRPSAMLIPQGFYYLYFLQYALVKGKLERG